jgi:hypothetical protein
MIAKKTIPILALIVLFLLPSCGTGGATGGNSLIGRWEYFSNEEHTSGFVLEFDESLFHSYEFSTATQLLYPLEIASTFYTYETGLGILSTETKRWIDPESDYIPSFIEYDSYLVAFLPGDQLQLTVEGQTETLTFQRVAVPEMPIGARAALGARLKKNNPFVLSVERLTGTWQEKFPGYVEVRYKNPTSLEQPEMWAATVQEEGSTEPRIYILVEGTVWWGVIFLEKAE